jgi:hypothetical protein
VTLVDDVVGALGRWRDGLRTLGDTWGTTDAERAAAYPVDRVLPDADQWLFRGIDVDAPVESTFRWLCQLRVAPYSYDWIDNLGRQSPQQLTPGLDDVAPGQRAMTMFRIVDVEPGTSITVHAPRSVFGEVAGTYRAVPVDAARSRIVVKLGVRYPAGFHAELLRDLLPAGDLIMMRKQLRTLASLAARSVATGGGERDG